MRTSATIRIIVYAFVALMLTGVLIWGIRGDNMGYLDLSTLFGNHGSSYNDKDYKIGGGEVATSNLTEMEVNWTAGSVNIEPYDGDTISLSEKNEASLDADHQLRYKVEDGKLTVQFAKPKVSLTGIFKNLNKDLTVKVPKNFRFNEASLDAVSANLEMKGIDADELNLSTVSGDALLEGVSSGQFDGESVSGDMDFRDCSLNLTTMETVSGQVKMSFDAMPTDVDIESVSGDMTLRFPKNEGFAVDYDKVSGSFDCQFNVAIAKNTAVYKNGQSKIHLETVSGDMNILAL